MKVIFDGEHNISKWLERFKRMESFTIQKISEPVIEVYLDDKENTIKNTPATSGETKAGWAKPLEVEGRSLVSVISPEMGILSKKVVTPKQGILEKGMEKSIYRKEIELESINLETINGTPGSVYTEYGDSRTPPTAAVRQAAMTLAEDVKTVISTTLKGVTK